LRTARGLAAALVVTLAACKHDPPASADAATADAAVSPPVDAGATATAHDAGADPHGYADKVRAWNDALNRKDMAALGPMYNAKSIVFYGTAGTTRAAVVKAKTGYLAKHPDFSQKIADLSVTGGRVTFAKTSTVGGKTTTYAAYLDFENGLVSQEGDETTDKNREDAREAGENCEDAVAAIVADQVRKASNECLELVDAAHDPTVHCGGMTIAPTASDPTWTFQTFIDHPEHIETLSFATVDLDKATATEMRGGEEKTLKFDRRAMDEAIRICANKPPK
jgi:hypothetical protein